MDVIDDWTGGHASALQAALRMTHDEYAATLGVGRRTVAAWHAKPDSTLRTDMQRVLDTMYERSTEAVKIRFARRVRALESSTDAGGVTLSVAIAIVIHGDSVLLVCRREESSGITWQFPAGIVKPGATATVIAVRETLAETGVHCAVRKSLGSRVHPMSKVNCEYFLCEYLSGEPVNLDTEENVSVMWVERAKVSKFIPPDRIYEAVASALAESEEA